MIRLKNTLQISLAAIVLLLLFPITSNAQWIQDTAGWRFEQDSELISNSWLMVDGVWYHFNENGYMDTGWITSNGSTYYLDYTGAMVTGTQILDGNFYSFSPSGEFLGGPVATHIDGLDDAMLADGIRQTDTYWAEINHILGLVNQERAKNGAAPLTLDKDLCNIAGYRCSYMEATGYYEHYIDGVDLSNTTASAYYGNDKNVGENLYCHYSKNGAVLSNSVLASAERGFNWYMQSPGHHDNMLNPSYKKIGLGIYSNPTNTRRFLTQIFLE